MKLKLIILFAALVFVPMVGVCSAHAQNGEVGKANVSFDFYGDRRMPAGTYYIGLDLANNIITISDNAGQRKVFLMGICFDNGGDKSELVFDHLGNDTRRLMGENDIFFLESICGHCGFKTVATSTHELLDDEQQHRTKCPPEIGCARGQLSATKDL